MDYKNLETKQTVANQAIVTEEQRGTASELLPNNTTFLTAAVRQEIQKLSVLEIIA